MSFIGASIRHSREGGTMRFSALNDLRIGPKGEQSE